MEKQLVALIGETGYKLHSGRSRNEQIATDLRLYVRAAIDELHAELADWLNILLLRAQNAGDASMPAYTHTQRAEPVLVAHWLMAYVEMFLRDAERFDGLSRCGLERVPASGSGAVAGATLALGWGALAADLGLRRANGESLDCHRRSGLRAGIRAGAFGIGAPPQPMGGGDDSVLDPGVRIYFASRSLTRRQQWNAAEEEGDLLELVRGKVGRVAEPTPHC